MYLAVVCGRGIGRRRTARSQASANDSPAVSGAPGQLQIVAQAHQGFDHLGRERAPAEMRGRIRHSLQGEATPADMNLGDRLAAAVVEPVDVMVGGGAAQADRSKIALVVHERYKA